MLRGVQDLESVIRDWGFWTALVLGGLGVAFVCARARHGHPEPGVAVVALVAGIVALRVDDRLPFRLVVGVVLLITGEWLVRELGTAARLAALVPGAVVLGAALPDGWPFWTRALVTLVTVGGGALVADAARIVPRWVPLLLAIGAAGVYVCVPDTEAPKCLLGAVLAAAFVALVPDVVATTGFATLTGLFVWVAAFGGLGRSGSVVGGAACLGIVVLVPAFTALTKTRVGIAALLLLQCAVVLFVARIAGFEEGAGAALALTVVAFAAAAAGLAVAERVRA